MRGILPVLSVLKSPNSCHHTSVLADRKEGGGESSGSFQLQIHGDHT